MGTFKQKVKECFKKFDANSDRRISFSEFVTFYNWFQTQSGDVGQDVNEDQPTPLPQVSMFQKARPSGAQMEHFVLTKDPVLGFGLQFSRITYDQQQARNIHYQILPGRPYLVVNNTRDGADRAGPATLQGIMKGDILLKAEREQIRSFDDFARHCRG